MGASPIRRAGMRASHRVRRRNIGTVIAFLLVVTMDSSRALIGWSLASVPPSAEFKPAVSFTKALAPGINGPTRIRVARLSGTAETGWPGWRRHGTRVALRSGWRGETPGAEQS